MHTSITTRCRSLHGPNKCHDIGRGVTALAAASSSQGGFIATGAGGCVVYLQPASGTVQASWQGGRYSVTAMAASESGRLVLGSATVSIWDAANKKRLFKFSGHAVSHQKPLLAN